MEEQRKVVNVLLLDFKFKILLSSTDSTVITHCLIDLLLPDRCAVQWSLKH